MSDTLKDVYEIICGKVDFTEEEFFSLSDKDKNAPFLQEAEINFTFEEIKSIKI